MSRENRIKVGPTIARTASNILSETFSTYIDPDTDEAYVVFKVMEGKTSIYVEAPIDDAEEILSAFVRGPETKNEVYKPVSQHISETLARDESNDGTEYYTFRTGVGKGFKTQKIKADEVGVFIETLASCVERARFYVEQHHKAKNKSL